MTRRGFGFLVLTVLVYLAATQTRVGWLYIIAAAMLLVDGLLFNALAMGGDQKLSSEVLANFFLYSSGLTIIASAGRRRRPVTVPVWSGVRPG